MCADMNESWSNYYTCFKDNIFDDDFVTNLLCWISYKYSTRSDQEEIH